MPNYQSPGVYIEEVSKGPKPIAGAPTNVAAILGRADRGPVLEPKRLTSWNDYLALFGGYSDDSYTPESVFGFFQNGGTALWMIRADNAGQARWRVFDSGTASGRASFDIHAASPGAWGADLSVRVWRETAGGRGELAIAQVTGPGATVDLTGGRTNVAVNVSSTAGFQPGMTVLFADASTSGAGIRATIDSIGTNELRISTTGGASSVTVALDARVFARANTGDAVMPLAIGSGFLADDLLRARNTRGTIAHAVIDTAQNAGAGVVLTLATPFDADVPGYQLTERTYDVPATRTASNAITRIGAAGGPTDLTFVGTAPGSTDILGVVSEGGVAGTWDGGANQFSFGTAVAAGPVTVSLRATLAAYSEPLSPWINLAGSDDDLQSALARFQFVPDGGVLQLAPAAGTAGGTQSVTRTATGWTIPATARGDYQQATFVPATTIPLVTMGPVRPKQGDWVEFSGSNRARVSEVQIPPGIPQNTYRIVFVSNPGGVGGTVWPVRAWQPTVIEPVRFGIEASYRAPGGEVQAETFGGLSLHPDHPRYYARDEVLNDVSQLIQVDPRTSATPLTTSNAYPVRLQQTATGSRGTLDTERFRLALEQLEKQQEPAMVACPDALQLQDDLERASVMNEVVAHCEAFKRFAVLDTPTFADDEDPDLLDWRMNTIASTYAAIYAPWVRMINPRRQALSRTVDIPPSGFVMGVFARTDIDRGVWKAPANEQVNGIVGLRNDFTQRRQDLLNPGGVNLLRAFRGRGIRVWGARNATDDTQWRYVNVRRLFLFIENSIERSTQWVVFEPNNETTWLRVRVSVENFLNGIWRQGGLMGTSPEQAYRVRVGLGQTMTETDIDLGYLIIEVGIAPTKPAEFVVFQISHKRLTD
ncbi:MAG: phage tail sheath subtilisin-like domain-containing protein [Gaiellaceae bacterium]